MVIVATTSSSLFSVFLSIVTTATSSIFLSVAPVILVLSLLVGRGGCDWIGVYPTESRKK